MRRALVLTAVTALAVARPEMYKEKEDFQYSRSSSDEGTKSGFYGAQRGNMGGNYERAHNMDPLAQHHMGSIVRTVEGELGDGAKQPSGSVFSSANSRGTYGSGLYDLGNLEGRNFQEGSSYGDSQSHSSLSSHYSGYGSNSHKYSTAQAGANSAYGSQSQNSRYHMSGNTDQALYANNMQSADNLQASEYDGTQLHGSGYQTQSGYHSQSGYQGHSIYDHTAASQLSSNAYGSSNTRGSTYRLVGASPVRVYIRPGSTVTVPVAAQSYDASHGSNSYDASQRSASYDASQRSATYDASRGIASNFDQNSINSEAEVLGTHYARTSKPATDAKHYESSYSYRKEWEKHSDATATAVPLAVPTVNPYPTNSELYEDTHTQGAEHQHQASAQEARNIYSNSQYKGYNIKTGSSGSQSAYDTHGHSASDTASVASSSANTHGAYNFGAANLNSANLNSQVEDFGSKPKSYQSSYSYHKSWERQGDPYIIKPATNGLYTTVNSQLSQKLTSASLNQDSSYGSHQYGSHYHQGHQGYSSDCDENGHIRVARSSNFGRDPTHYQQSQNLNEGYGQQSQNLEDLGQQSQNLEDFGQQSQNVQDFGQQSQKLEDFGQQSQNLKDFGQQAQNLEDLGQQPQNLQDFGQQSQNHEDLGQQAQSLQDLGQESQNLEDLGQQLQSLQDFGGQQPQNLQNFGQEAQNLEDLGQQTQNVGQITQSQFDKIEDFGQHAQSQWDQRSQTDVGQETQNTWNMLETIQTSKDKDNQQSQDNPFEISHPSIHKPESRTVEVSKPTLFANTDRGNSNMDKIDVSKQDIGKDFMQVDNLDKQTGLHNQFYTQSFQSYGNQNAYAPLSPFEWDRTNPDRMDWQKHLENQHINTGYGHHQHNQYQTGYDSNSWIFNKPSYTLQTPGNEYSGYDQSWVFNPPYSNSNSFIPNSGYGYSYTNTMSYNNNPRNPNSYTNTQTLNNNPVSSNTYTNAHITRNNQSTYTTSNIQLNTHNSGSTSLTNIWDLIDDIEKQTISTTETDYNPRDWYHKVKEDEQIVNQNKKNELINSDFNMTNVKENSFNNNDQMLPIESTTSITTSTTFKQNNLHHGDDTERGDVGPEKHKPQEEPGRGDIGPQVESNEDFSTPRKPLEIISTKPTSYKTPKEIDILSLIKENNKTESVTLQIIPDNKKVNLDKYDKQVDTTLGVLSLHDQKMQHSERDNWMLQSDIQRTTSTTPKSSYSYVSHHFNGQHESLQHNSEQQLDNLGKFENVDQQSYNQFQSFDQQNGNLDQQLTDFGQQSEVEGQQSPQKFDNFDQQNIEHHLPNLEQGPEDIQQQNMDQQFETLGKQSEDLGQQSFNQFEDFGQQNENLGQELQQPQQNMDQQFETLGKQSGDLGQLSFNQFEDFGQQNENLGQELQQPQQNMDQQFETLGKKSGDLGQLSFNQFEDFGQQNENLGQELQQPQQNMDQQFETLGKQSEDLGQQSLNQFEEFGQQNENLGQELQQPDNFGQGFQKESLGGFGQNKQFLQETLPNFNQQSEILHNSQNEQQLENFGKNNEDVGQHQNADLWKLVNQQDQKLKQVEVKQVFEPSSYNKEGKDSSHNEPVFEPEITKQYTGVNNADIPPEPVTEKTGFWNKVGTKLSSAKDTVKSWFSNS